MKQDLYENHTCNYSGLYFERYFVGLCSLCADCRLSFYRHFVIWNEVWNVCKYCKFYICLHLKGLIRRLHLNVLTHLSCLNKAIQLEISQSSSVSLKIPFHYQKCKLLFWHYSDIILLYILNKLILHNEWTNANSSANSLHHSTHFPFYLIPSSHSTHPPQLKSSLISSPNILQDNQLSVKKAAAQQKPRDDKT